MKSLKPVIAKPIFTCNVETLIAELKRRVADYTYGEVSRMSRGLLKYIEDENVTWWHAYFYQYGIDRDKIELLRERFEELDFACRLASDIMEYRYTQIPQHKSTLTKHFQYMLQNAIGRNWKASEIVNVGIVNGTIFEQLDTKPIIEIGDQSNARMIESSPSLNLNLMEPESEAPPRQRNEMDVSVCNDEKPSPSRNFFSPEKPVSSSVEFSKKDYIDLEGSSVELERSNNSLIELSNNFFSSENSDPEEAGNASKEKKGKASKPKKRKKKRLSDDEKAIEALRERGRREWKRS
jgi:hypothetical protein